MNQSKNENEYQFRRLLSVVRNHLQSLNLHKSGQEQIEQSLLQAENAFGISEKRYLDNYEMLCGCFRKNQNTKKMRPVLQRTFPLIRRDLTCR